MAGRFPSAATTVAPVGVNMCTLCPADCVADNCKVDVEGTGCTACTAPTPETAKFPNAAGDTCALCTTQTDCMECNSAAVNECTKCNVDRWNSAGACTACGANSYINAD